MIKLSVITPTFNNINKLKKNIASVSNQTFKNMEHVIVDNISDDGTDKLVEDYRKRVQYPVVYIRERDNGIYNAMNKGVRAAKGEWIHILNSDDCYSSNKILELLISEDICRYDVVASSILVRDGKTNKISSKWVPEYIKEINHYNFPHSGMVIKKKFYKVHGYYNEKYRILSDSMFCMKNLPKADYKIITKPLVVMLNSGVSNKFSFTKIYELIIFNLLYYKGPIRYKIKFIFLNLLRDLFLLFRILRNKFRKLIKLSGYFCIY